MTLTPIRAWHAIFIVVAANLVSALPAGFAGDAIFYNSFAQPVVAPPAWLFPPVWLFLNITSAIALYRVARVLAGHERRLFIASEAVGWVTFLAFSYLYFLMQSSILAAADTALGLFAALLSAGLAWRADRLSALLIGLRVAWLLLATYVSAWVAINNTDPLLFRLFN